MKKTLVVFTHKYPYEPPTEQFFHQELKYLQQKFNKIILIPTSREINIINKYKVAKNIVVIQIKRKSKMLELFIGLILNTFTNKRFWLEIISLFKGENYNTIKNLYGITASYARSGSLGFQIKRSLREEIDKDENILFYSYWLNNNVIIASDYKKYLLRKKIVNVKAIARAHGQGDLYVNCRFQSDNINDNIDRIYSISNKGKDFLVNNGLKNSIIDVKRLGVVKQLISDRKSKGFLIVSCSVLNSNKRVDKIINSLSLLSDETITWIHFGDGELMQYIKNLCSEKLLKNITWELRGRTPNEEIIDFYVQVKPTIFINVSSIEGIPVSIMEAMSCGIPVIATDVGATSEIVDHGENGFLLKEEFDEIELSNLIKFVYHNYYKTKHLGLNAYDKWNNYYNAEVNYAAFANSCNYLIESINEKGISCHDRK